MINYTLDNTEFFEAIVIGAGAAGLFCSSLLGQAGKRVLLLDKANKVGKKILMSGGGRCNFTNLHTGFKNYLSHNRHFCKSALSRYTPSDFIALVEKHQIPYYEKTLGQLFCQGKSKDIVDMLLSECAQGNVHIKLNQQIERVDKANDGFVIQTPSQCYQSPCLIIACGGLSIPTMGASPFGYQLAEQFGLNVYPTRAGLVPLTWHAHDKARYADLAGVSCDATVTCNDQSFREALLFTHRGLSGPAILQISSYWHPGDTINVSLLPDVDIEKSLAQNKHASAEQQLGTVLATQLPKRLLKIFFKEALLQKKLKALTVNDLQYITQTIQHWQILPNGTEGYRTAEVTLGGVDCDELSSKTFETHKVPGLYFIGEVLDVTGWLGGYNFQWAWSSAYACATAIIQK